MKSSIAVRQHSTAVTILPSHPMPCAEDLEFEIVKQGSSLSLTFLHLIKSHYSVLRVSFNFSPLGAEFF